MTLRNLALTCWLLLFTACANTLPSAGPGWIFTGATEAVQANNGVEITHRGEACAINILGLVSAGDSTVEKANRNGNITRVATIDRSFFSILGIYGSACTQVAGN